MTVRRAGKRRSENSTIVRISIIRAGIALLGRLSPPLAAAAVERLLSTPPRPRRSRGRGPLSRGRRVDVPVDGRPVAAWRFGGAGPAVLLVHGWGGQAAQLTSFVAPLVDRGFGVLAFDGPGHGRSGRGMSSAPQLARAVRAVADLASPLHGVVAHSLGAAATAVAMEQGLSVRRVAFVAPMLDPVGRLGELNRVLGVPDHVADRVRERSERRIRVRWDDLRSHRLARDPGVPALVVRDRDDREVSARDGEAAAASWSDVRFVRTAGLGHNRVLRSSAVVEEIVRFVTEGAESCGCGRPRRLGDAVCEACALEGELFDPRRRPSVPAALTAAGTPAR
jgi:alpha-beta hydrolase superfamily lysophospholipase